MSKANLPILNKTTTPSLNKPTMYTDTGTGLNSLISRITENTPTTQPKFSMTNPTYQNPIDVGQATSSYYDQVKSRLNDLMYGYNKTAEMYPTPEGVTPLDPQRRAALRLSTEYTNRETDDNGIPMGAPSYARAAAANANANANANTSYLDDYAKRQQAILNKKQLAEQNRFEKQYQQNTAEEDSSYYANVMARLNDLMYGYNKVAEMYPTPEGVVPLDPKRRAELQLTKEYTNRETDDNGIPMGAPSYARAAAANAAARQQASINAREKGSDALNNYIQQILDIANSKGTGHDYTVDDYYKMQDGKLDANNPTWHHLFSARDEFAAERQRQSAPNTSHVGNTNPQLKAMSNHWYENADGERVWGAGTKEEQGAPHHDSIIDKSRVQAGGQDIMDRFYDEENETPPAKNTGSDDNGTKDTDLNDLGLGSGGEGTDLNLTDFINQILGIDGTNPNGSLLSSIFNDPSVRRFQDEYSLADVNAQLQKNYESLFGGPATWQNAYNKAYSKWDDSTLRAMENSYQSGIDNTLARNNIDILNAFRNANVSGLTDNASLGALMASAGMAGLGATEENTTALQEAMLNRLNLRKSWEDDRRNTATNTANDLVKAFNEAQANANAYYLQNNAAYRNQFAQNLYLGLLDYIQNMYTTKTNSQLEQAQIATQLKELGITKEQFEKLYDSGYYTKSDK